jgi:uncharacterized OB-fold protein
MGMEIRDAPFDLPLSALGAPANADSAPARLALAEGRLSLQRCRACSEFRHPVAPVCSCCGSTEYEWSDAPTRGLVYSSVTYVRAPLPLFQHLAPYSVVCVELERRLRLFGRWLGPHAPAIGDPALAVVERWKDGDHSVAFLPAG